MNFDETPSFLPQEDHTCSKVERTIVSLIYGTKNSLGIIIFVGFLLFKSCGGGEGNFATLRMLLIFILTLISLFITLKLHSVTQRDSYLMKQQKLNASAPFF